MKAFGYEIGEIFAELDESGARKDRPMLTAAIERVERGESDGIVVAKLDRFGRSLVDGLQLIDRIQDAGGTFASVQDGFDLRTDTGRLVLRIMLSMAEYELERVRSNWNDAKAPAVMRGVHPSARVPFGYRREGRGGPLFVDATAGALVTELFRRRAQTRMGYTELARWLNSQGVLTGGGRPSWSLRGVKDIIRNRVYLGVAYAGDVENPDAHPALIDAETWRAAQHTGQRIPRRAEHVSPLGGLMRCAACRYLIGSSGAHDRAATCGALAAARPRARRSGSATRPLGSCSASSSTTRSSRRSFPACLTSSRARRTTPRLDEAAQAVDAARVAFERWRDDIRIEARLGMDAYVDALQTRQDALKLALAELARQEAKTDALRLPADLGDLRRQWPSLTTAERNKLMQAAMLCVFVRAAGSGARLDDRVRIVWRGAVTALPRKGHTDWMPRAANFDDLDRQPCVSRLALAQD